MRAHPAPLAGAFAVVLVLALGAAPAGARDLATELPPVPRGAAPEARPGGPSATAARSRVLPVLRRARRSGTLDAATYDAYRGLYRDAVRTRRGLKGARRRELHAVVATLERIAGRGLLSPSRMAPLFLQLHRNTAFWRSRPFPRSGARFLFEGSPVLFQFYPGQGLQLQPLANFGRAAGMWYPCRRARRRGGDEQACRDMAALVDWLLALPSRRGRGIAWEYFFSFGGGTPPWTSAMSQATALQALARARRLFDDTSLQRFGDRALSVFEDRPPAGVRKPARGGAHYLLYSFSPGLEVLNSFAKTVVGLFDYARVTRSTRARRLLDDGQRRLRRELPLYDTGSWSLYSRGGAPASASYHRLARDFLDMLCKRLKDPRYCGTAGRFTLYLKRRSNGNPDTGKDTGPGPGLVTVPTGSDRWEVELVREGPERRLAFTRR